MTGIPVMTVRIGGGRTVEAVDLPALTAGRALPYSMRIVLENAARASLADPAREADARRVARWTPGGTGLSVALDVSRVVLPDSSGLPALLDLAAARDLAVSLGRSPGVVEPVVPVDLVVDHSLIVDVAGRADAMTRNIEAEYARNGERYAFLKWAQQAFEKLAVVPPGSGIIHQVHLERIARVVAMHEMPHGKELAAPEFVLGCDSHTPMVNGLGLLAWGVGGIEGEAAMLGEPYTVQIPRVVGVRLEGRLPAATTTTDLVLTITARLREVGVTGAFVEFFGPGLPRLTVPERATIANMAPEYGATVGFFPIDEQSVAYLRQSGREEADVALVEGYARAAGLFADPGAEEPEFDEVVEVDLSSIGPTVAGPKRP